MPRGITLLALIVAAVATVLIATVLHTLNSGYRTDGPLVIVREIELEWQTRAGTEGSWGMPLPQNPTTSELVFESIEPGNVEGLDILGVLASGQGCEVPALATAFPPPGIDTRDPSGFVLNPLSQPCDLHAIVGFRLHPEVDMGKVGYLRLRYRHAGERYQTDLPWALVIRPEP